MHGGCVCVCGGVRFQRVDISGNQFLKPVSPLSTGTAPNKYDYQHTTCKTVFGAGPYTSSYVSFHTVMAVTHKQAEITASRPSSSACLFVTAMTFSERATWLGVWTGRNV